MDFDYCHYMMTDWTPRDSGTAIDNIKLGNSDCSILHKEFLAANFLYSSASYTQPRPLLAIRASTIRGSLPLGGDDYHTGRMPSPVVLPLQATRKIRTQSSPRFISPSPTSVLDVPGLRDNYYLNLMTWGRNGIVAIALGQCVYLYSTETRKIQKLKACTYPIDYVTSVAWLENTNITPGSQSGSRQLAVGTSLAELQVWDVERCAKVRWMYSQSDRIDSLSWSSNGTLATGSRDSSIHLHDVRAAQHVVGEFVHHREEVCGLAWSPDGSTLASGSNDNYLCIWDRAMLRPNRPDNLTSPRSSHLQHYAAVRALAWSPWERHVLASGGGAADGTIKLWNSSSGKLQRSVPTGSQVCALVWSTTSRELMSAHGHGTTANQLTVWNQTTMERVRDLTGHTARVLHLAISPNGMSVASAGADETLRFWDVFPPLQSSWTQLNSGGRFDMPTAAIR